MERQEYLQYFINAKKKPSSTTIYNQHNNSKVSRSLHTQVNKTQKKILPHISEEYQYKITNQLLVHKIMNPKRDKLITENFQKPPSRPGTRQRKTRHETSNEKSNERMIQIQSLDAERRPMDQPTPGYASLYTRIRMRQQLSKYKHKGIKSYEKEFNLALENQRMGRRILKTKSSVEQILKKTFYTYKNNEKGNQNEKENCQPDLKNSFIRGRQNNKIYFSGKINNGVKVFFNPVRNDEKSLSRAKSLHQSKISETSQQRIKNEESDSDPNIEENSIQHPNRQTKTSNQIRTRLIQTRQNDPQQKSKHIETHFPQSFKIFGKGPTILMLYDLQITSNPPLKQDSMLILQLITHQKRLSIKKNKQKSLRTTPVSYDFIKPSQSPLTTNCIRFAINVSEIGDFVPLRVYKVHGVEIQQLGIIDVDLAAFRYRRSEMIGDESDGMLVKEFKVGRFGEKLEREVVTCRVEGNLRKNLLNKPVETFVRLSYKVYPKRFKQGG